MERIPDVSDRIPVRADVDWRVEPDGRVAIEKRKFRPATAKLMAAFKVRPTLTVRLDALGSAAWQRMDGRSVGAILQALQADFPDEDDLGQRLGQYLSTLVSNEMVRLE